MGDRTTHGEAPADGQRYTRMSTRSRDNAGKVYLVGAGPGDPGLITLRGVQCLAEADVVFGLIL